MLRSDFLIHNEVRRELARSQANLGKVQFGVTRGVIYFAGEFWVGTGLKKLDRNNYFDVLVGALVGLEKRLRRIPGVADIFFRFNNIQKTGGFWRRAKVRVKAANAVFVLRNNREIIEENESPDEKDEEK